jgi:hypothetical protein
MTWRPDKVTQEVITMIKGIDRLIAIAMKDKAWAQLEELLAHKAKLLRVARLTGPIGAVVFMCEMTAHGARAFGRYLDGLGGQRLPGPQRAGQWRQMLW